METTERINRIAAAPAAQGRELDRQVRGFVHDRPYVAVMAAVAFGYFVARVAART